MDDRIVTGRTWQRIQPEELALSFSPRTMDFLMWATATDCSNASAFWSPDFRGSVTPGDRLLVTLAYAATRETSIGRCWAEQRPWREELLCQLLFAADFKYAANARLDFSCWLSRPGSSPFFKNASAESLVLTPSLRQHAILEVNAFGDLLPGITDRRQETYAAELQAAFQLSLPDSRFVA